MGALPLRSVLASGHGRPGNARCIPPPTPTRSGGARVRAGRTPCASCKTTTATSCESLRQWAAGSSHVWRGGLSEGAAAADLAPNDAGLGARTLWPPLHTSRGHRSRIALARPDRATCPSVPRDGRHVCAGLGRADFPNVVRCTTGCRLVAERPAASLYRPCGAAIWPLYPDGQMPSMMSRMRCDCAPQGLTKVRAVRFALALAI